VPYNGYVATVRNVVVEIHPELAFTELILQISYRIYKIVIHSHVVILDLPTNICRFVKIYIISFFYGKLGCF
jgi:hypothetical protein